jgi:hypothetical protein
LDAKIRFVHWRSPLNNPQAKLRNKAALHRKRSNLGEIMAKRSSASHLREMRILRNNQAKIINDHLFGARGLRGH